MKKNCLVIGDLNIDLIMNDLADLPEMGREIIAGNNSIDIGGSGGIFSAVLSGLGVNTYIISKIGNDLYGKFLIDKLKSYDVNINRLIIEDKEETGITVTLSYKKDKYQISALNQINNLSIDEIIFKNIKNIGHVHFTSYYMMKNLKKDYEKLICNIRKNYKDVTISLDSNDDPDNKWDEKIYKILDKIDIFLPNKKEALNITKESNVDKALAKLSKIIKTTVIKLGNKGYIAVCEGNYYSGDSLKVNFADSTGAGDNFNAGFIYGFINNYGINKSLHIATICGAESIKYIGGVGNEIKFKRLKEKVSAVEN